MVKAFFYAASLYLLFVIYGSLVPLDYRGDMPITEAISRFKNIPYLDLGMESRADWIANILLYMPLAFLWLAAFKNVRHPFFRAAVTLAVLGFCLTLAVLIEFAQLFFPPRTVSLNDLLAETIGTVLGLLLWHGCGKSLLKLYGQLSLGSFLSVKAAILFYILIYVAIGLFPFDFITSFRELELRLASENVQFFLSFSACSEDVARCLVKLAVEALVLSPLGLLFCLLPYISHRLIVTLLIGFFLGIFTECAQLFLVSGVAEGVSVLTRMLGMSLGYFLYIFFKKHEFSSLTRWFRPMVLLAAVPYLYVAVAVNGWTKGGWLPVSQAIEKLTDTQFLPFYYFYYTSETIALISLLSNIGTYVPIGLAYWAWIYKPSAAPRNHWAVAGWFAAGLAVIIETGKLFLADKHADPTDILLAFAAAGGTSAFLNRLQQLLSEEKPVKAEHTVLDQEFGLIAASVGSVPRQNFSPWLARQAGNDEIATSARWLSGVVAIIIGWALFNYPSKAQWLACFLIVYGYLLSRFPQSWLVVIPFLLPTMDFTPWTGRIFFDEFDLVILTTLAVYYWYRPRRPPARLFSKATYILLWFYGIFYFISLIKGVWPLAPIDANSFANYYSSYNGLRVGKGMIWALLLIPLLRQALARYSFAVFNYLGAGILAGLGGVIIFSLAERIVFPGFFDFSSDYRINALFSSMHTGGGHIESYLALAFPFVTMLFFSSAHPYSAGASGAILFITGLYVLLVTFSRGGYIGFVISFLVLLIALAVSRKAKPIVRWRPVLLAFSLLASALLVAFPVFHGSYIQHRFGLFNQDKTIRSDHWRDAVNMMDDNFSTYFWGMGLGSYPRTYFWLNSENVTPATYKIALEKDNDYLQLRGGDALYFGQYVTVFSHTKYRLTIDLRTNEDNLPLTVFVCEKSLQFSFNCVSTELNAKVSVNKGWQHAEQVIDSGELGINSKGIAGNLLRRPVQIALYNANGPSSLFDIDNVGLLDPMGDNLVANGDFSSSTDFWFFSTEKHHPWHILNLWVQILFEQGWLGIIGFLLLIVNAIYGMCKNIGSNLYYAIFLASLSGFFVVGMVDSPFDAPRLTLLFMLILFFSLARVKKAV